MDYVLIKKFKMNIKTVLFCILLEFSAYLFFDNTSFYSFYLCFIIIGILKTIVKLKKHKSDVSSYKISNFTYSAGISIFFSIYNIFIIDINNNLYHLFSLYVICSIAALIVDTAASEMGQLFKVNTYNILNLKEVKQGYDGGISIFGTISSSLVLLLFLLISTLYFDFKNIEFINIFFAAFISNFIDSFVGATLQSKKIVSNEQTNFIAIFSSIILFTLFNIIF